MAMSSQPKAHSFMEISMSQYNSSNDQYSRFHTTLPRTPPPSPTFSVAVLQNQSSYDRCLDLRVHESKRILQSCDVRNNELLCRFGLCGDDNLSVIILQSRQESRLDIMLKCLDINADNWDRNTKVRAILGQPAPKQPLTTSQWT